MPVTPVPMSPGKVVNTTTPTITIVGIRQAGKFTFTLVVTDDAGLTGSAEWTVTVRPG